MTDLDRVFGHKPSPVRRDRVTREEIAGKTIIVVRKQGHDMGRTGPKLKPGYRQPNGRLRVPTKDAQNEINRKRILDETYIARMQPHRMGSADKLLTCALGRFCRRTGCKDAVYDGVEAYAKFKHRWSVAMGRPRGFENIGEGAGGSGEGPTAEQVAKWLSTVISIETMLKTKFGGTIFNLVHKLAIEGQDIPLGNDGRIRAALGEVAIMTGCLDRNPHPFRG